MRLGAPALSSIAANSAISRASGPSHGVGPAGRRSHSGASPADTLPIGISRRMNSNIEIKLSGSRGSATFGAATWVLPLMPSSHCTMFRAASADHRIVR